MRHTFIITQKFCFSLSYMFLWFFRVCHVLLHFKSLNKLLIYQSVLLWTKIFVLPPLIDDNLFSIFEKSFPTHCAYQYKYVPSVGPIVYHLFPFHFFSPSWPLSSCTASVTMFALITSEPFRSPPHLSFVFFSISIQLSSFQDAHISLLSSAFLSF